MKGIIAVYLYSSDIAGAGGGGAQNATHRDFQHSPFLIVRTY